MVFNKRTQKTITGRLQKKRVDVKNIRLLMSYAIDDFELVVANNGALHITRILLPLILGNDLQVKLNNKSHKLIKDYEKYIKMVNELNVEEKGLFMDATDILERSITQFSEKEGKFPIPNVVKNQDLDEKYLNKEIENYLKKK